MHITKTLHYSCHTHENTRIYTTKKTLTSEVIAKKLDHFVKEKQEKDKCFELKQGVVNHHP